MAYGNGVYVAVGASGTNLVSTDGIQWTVNPSLGAFNLTSLVFANGSFLAAGYNSGDAPIVASSSDGVHWVTNTNSFQSVSLPYALAFGNGTYVAVSNSSNILHSTDGIAWSAESGTTSHHAAAVAFGNGKFVAAGGGTSSGNLASSTDGITWTSQTVGSYTFTSVAAGNGIFVAVTQTGKIYSSSDGINWSLGTANIISDYSMISGSSALRSYGAVTFANGQFLLPVGNTAMFASADGVQWTSHLLRTSSILNSSTYGNGRYVTVGTGSAIFTSDDGCNWIERSNSISGTMIYAGAYGNAMYVAAGESGKISTSTDTINWRIRSSGTTKTIYGNTYGASGFVVVGDAGTVCLSPDGSTWLAQTSHTNALLAAVIYASGQYVAVGANGTVVKSSNGSAWTASSAGTIDALTGVAFGNGLYAAISAKGEVFTSPDATTWTAQNSGFTSFLSSIAFGQGRFVASGWGGAVITSTDGVNWTPSAPVTTQCLHCVIYNAPNGHFVAAGAATGFISSADGVNWTLNTSDNSASAALIAEPTGTTMRLKPDGTTYGVTVGSTGITSTSPAFTGHNFHGVTWGASRFVAVGDVGAIFASSDGITWTNQASTPGANYNWATLFAVVYGGNRFVAVGGINSDGIFTSSDGGNTWVNHSLNTSSALLAVAYGNGHYVATGNNGKIVYSNDGSNWTAATSGTSDNLVGIAYGNGKFVAMGNSSSVLTSTDGITWQANSFFGGRTLRFDNGLFVGIGQLGIQTSPDGVTWTKRSTPTNFMQITGFGNNLYVAVADSVDGAQTYVSRDTSKWYATTSSLMSNPGLRSIAFDGNGVFVAVGDNGTILRSTLSWPSLAQWRTVYYDTASNTGNAADTAAPLNDGVTNIVKYALGLDPRQNGADILPVSQVAFDPGAGANYLTLTVNRTAIAPGVNYIAEVSSDLVNWQSTPNVDVVYLTNTPLQLQVRDNTPISGASPARRFIRLRITEQ